MKNIDHFVLGLESKLYASQEEFKQKFIESPKVKTIIEAFFAAGNPHASPLEKAKETIKFYEIVKWNLGLPEGHEKRKLYVNESFWKDARILLKAYSRIWLTEEEGEKYLNMMLDTRKPFPEVVENKIRVFCKDQLTRLEILSKDNLDECVAITREKLLDNDRQVIKSIKVPGSLWVFLRTFIKNLFKITWEFSFTECFSCSDNRIYAHLTIYSSSYIKKELIDNALYYYEIRPVFCENIIDYYYPGEGVVVKRDNAKWNDAIKKELSDKLTSLKIPYSRIGLSIDETIDPSILIVPSFTPELRSIYPFQDRLVEEDCSQEELIQPFAIKMDNESPLVAGPESYTDFEVKQLIDVIFDGEDVLRKVFITYTTQTGNKVNGENFKTISARKLYHAGLLKVETDHPLGSAEWEESLGNRLLKLSKAAQDLFEKKAHDLNLSVGACMDIIRYCKTKSLDEQFD